MQRHGVGLAADVARDDADRAELAHRPRVAEDHAVEQRPLDVRQRDAPEDLPAAGAEHARRLFLLGALRLHQRDQLAGDEREGDEDRREHDARARAKMIFRSWSRSHSPNQPCRPKTST